MIRTGMFRTGMIRTGMIRTAIVDDEPLARQILRDLLAPDREIELVVA